MIRIDNKKDCCGCTACMNICPKNAIQMVMDDEGFSYPKVDESKCVNCGLCNKICPFINSRKDNKIKNIYAAHTKDEELLLCSSSGGVFGEISKYILKNKGKVVGVNNQYNYIMIHNYNH